MTGTYDCKFVIANNPDALRGRVCGLVPLSERRLRVVRAAEAAAALIRAHCPSASTRFVDELRDERIVALDVYVNGVGNLKPHIRTREVENHPKVKAALALAADAEGEVLRVLGANLSRMCS